MFTQRITFLVKDIAYRLGKKKPTSTFSRPMVVKFVTRKERKMVLKHAKNLKGKQQYVNEQLPAEMRECRVAQNQHVKELRRDNPDQSVNKIHFVKDILMHNGHVVDAQLKVSLNIMSCQSRMLYPLNMMLYIILNLYKFEAVSSRQYLPGPCKRDALFQDDLVASAEHIMYAKGLILKMGFLRMEILMTANVMEAKCFWTI